MNNPSTVEQLREMRFSAMATEFEAQIQDPTTYAQVSFEDRFGLLVNAEWNRRQTNKLVRRIRDAHLDIPSASMEGIEYYEDRKLDKAQMIPFSSSLLKGEREKSSVNVNQLQKYFLLSVERFE